MEILIRYKLQVEKKYSWCHIYALTVICHLLMFCRMEVRLCRVKVFHLFWLRSLQQQRHGAPVQHKVQEQSASVRPAAGDA